MLITAFLEQSIITPNLPKQIFFVIASSFEISASAVDKRHGNIISLPLPFGGNFHNDGILTSLQIAGNEFPSKGIEVVASVPMFESDASFAAALHFPIIGNVDKADGKILRRKNFIVDSDIELLLLTFFDFYQILVVFHNYRIGTEMFANGIVSARIYVHKIFLSERVE